MTTEIRIPKIGISMTEGTLAEWLVEDGASVEAGTPLYSIDIDKSTNEIESPVAGTVKLIGTPGEVYDIGTLIATID